MNEADARIMAEIEPIEHLKSATLLIKKIYEEELRKTMDKKIRFKHV